jgi:putative ubiquitin-RnfH superfamily antitoxin RatB of RatAB toxin-antitoxin module
MAEKSAATSIEVVYATADEQYIVTVQFSPGMTAARAVELSGLLEAYPAIAGHDRVLGIYGIRVEPEHLLAPGDRVEICRPLNVDPRTLRRILAASGKVMGGAKKGARE